MEANDSKDLVSFIIMTNNITNMSYMFDGCSTLTSINVSNFKINNVTNMSRMFNGCFSLFFRYQKF